MPYPKKIIEWSAKSENNLLKYVNLRDNFFLGIKQKFHHVLFNQLYHFIID